MPHRAGLLSQIKCALKQYRLWARFRYDRLFRVQKINATIALLHQATNYYHFLAESIGAAEQIRQAQLRGENLTIDYYLLDTSMPYQREMWRLLGIPESKILPLRPHRLIQANQIVVPTLLANFEHVEYRDGIFWSHPFALPMILRDFYRSFDKLLLEHSHHIPTTKQRKVFLARPKDSNRNFINAAEVESIFARFGYEIILPDSLSFIEQVQMAKECKILASMHGAGLSNALFMQEGACVFEIYPQYYHYPCPQFCALLMGQRYFYMIAHTPDTTPHPQQESAHVCPQELAAALTKLESYL